MEEYNRLSFVIPVIIVLVLFFSNLFCDNMFPQLSGSNHVFSVLFLKSRQNAFDELQLNTKKYTECLFCVTKYNSNNPFIQFISKFPCWWDSWFVDKFFIKRNNNDNINSCVCVCVFVCETFFYDLVSHKHINCQINWWPKTLIYLYHISFHSVNPPECGWYFFFGCWMTIF